jgi:hypothetical protein
MRSPEATLRILTSLLLSAVCVCACWAEEPALFALSPQVGDTVDAAERDSFLLFPGITGFRHAVFLAAPDSTHYARVALGNLRPVYFRLSRNQLGRMQFIIENHSMLSDQLRSDQNAVVTYQAFWDAALSAPIDTIGGRPVPLNITHRGMFEEPGPSVQPTYENRYKWTLHGATCGSVAGGCLGSYAGYTMLEPGRMQQTECGSIYVPPLYQVNFPALFATTVGVTALGGAGGYLVGQGEDRKPVQGPWPGEKHNWREGCIGAGLIPAVALGALAAVAAEQSMYSREQQGYRLKNDPHGLTLIPPVLTGLCVSVEILTISYYIGREIDRSVARRAALRKPQAR